MPRPFRASGLVAALTALTFVALPASAGPFPHIVPLPTDFQPEGIAVGAGSTFYVGSLHDGDIYRGDLRTGDGALFVDTAGRAALGMRVDRAHGYLVVAGAPPATGSCTTPRPAPRWPTWTCRPAPSY